MKDNKKKILAAAAFLIAAGLVFGMSKKENGIRELDDSGAVVMSGSMQELMGSEGKRDAEKNTKLSTDSSIPDGEKNPQTESESGVGESREAGNETGTGKSPSETQVEVDNSKAAGSMCISAERFQIPACMSFPRTAGSTRRWMPQADLRRMRRVRASTSRRRSVTGCRSRSIIRKKLHRFRQAVRQQVKIPGRIRCRDLLHLST